MKGYCTDCENEVTIINGRCGCGSGRVIVSATVEATSDITKSAEALAGDILKAAGSNLQHYESYSREKIIAAALKGIEAERARAVNDVLGMLTCHELYQYRPGAFKGFVVYARETLCIPEPESPEVTKHFGRNFFNAGWNMAGGDYKQEEAFLQFIGKAA